MSASGEPDPDLLHTFTAMTLPGFRLFSPILVQRPRENRYPFVPTHSTVCRADAPNHASALVTGGGTGLGKTIASALVQNGAKVYIAARKEAQLKEVRSVCGG